MISRLHRTAAVVRAHRLFGLAKRPRKVLPRQQIPRLIEREYAAAIIDYMVPRIKRALAPLMARLPSILERAARARKVTDHLDGEHYVVDAGEGRELQDALADVRDTLGDSIDLDALNALAEKFGRRTSEFNRRQLGRQTQAALGVDVVGADQRVPAIIDQYVAQNVSLIKSIGDQVAARVEALVTQAITDGDLAGDLADKLEAIGFGEKRAAVIARDQIGKLNGQINASRQQEMGVERFVWRTVEDERVRPEHEDLDGEEFSYDEPPSEGLPGEPVMCRCWAEPVFEPILDASDDESDVGVADPEDQPDQADDA